MRTHLPRLRAALVLLLVGSGLLFGIGSTIERRQHHGEHHAATSPSGENGKSGESGSESGSGERATHAESGHGESGVSILGVNTESVALTGIAVVASLLLAVLVWLGYWPRLTLLAAAGFGLVFAAGDARETRSPTGRVARRPGGDRRDPDRTAPCRDRTGSGAVPEAHKRRCDRRNARLTVDAPARP